jgi:hypothetical protein
MPLAHTLLLEERLGYASRRLRRSMTAALSELGIGQRCVLVSILQFLASPVQQ